MLPSVRAVHEDRDALLDGMNFDYAVDCIDTLTPKVHFIKYEDLCLRPEMEMQRAYHYLGIPDYSHDFNHIEQVTKEDDEVYGAFGDHKIRRELTLTPSTANKILGKDVTEWIYNNYRWFFDYFKYSK